MYCERTTRATPERTERRAGRLRAHDRVARRCGAAAEPRRPRGACPRDHALPVPRGARTVRVTARGRKLWIETVAGSVVPQLTQTIAHMFRLDEDLSRFYELVREDELAWCAQGAGRMLRAPTVFEDVVKTN